ncbi:disease resistance protein isoform X1 [Cinnamomum micranthum f. kanehirae]|uniref:Disease resistance protein isoform X1 n=1 Tax=Cinnamomum micranthum f. kanehirae TaxID=337451 RepID=A0A3S3NWR3_9MAGN|nr:disease resistance protein isoform X1 [Cinnamomum micranthum f. kanehirae]
MGMSYKEEDDYKVKGASEGEGKRKRRARKTVALQEEGKKFSLKRTMYEEEEAQKGMSGENPEKLLETEKTKKETGKDSARGAMNRMMDRISECMSDDKINRISILGWEGMGRSTIINKLVEQLSYRFDDVKRVSASDCYDAGDLQTEIMEALGIKKDVKDAPSKIASALNVKKVLLILEDVDEPIELDKIISPEWEEKTQGSSKVVVTTASEKV